MHRDECGKASVAMTKTVERRIGLAFIDAWIVGFALIACGAFGAYGWYYRYAPERRMNDPDWRRQRSALAHWQAFRSCYDRRDWPHDAFSIGRSGRG